MNSQQRMADIGRLTRRCNPYSAIDTNLENYHQLRLQWSRVGRDVLVLGGW